MAASNASPTKMERRYMSTHSDRQWGQSVRYQLSLSWRHKMTRGPTSIASWVFRVRAGGGGRRELYLTLQCHHQNDSCTKMGSEDSVNYWSSIHLAKANVEKLSMNDVTEAVVVQTEKEDEVGLNVIGCRADLLGPNDRKSQHITFYVFDMRVYDSHALPDTPLCPKVPATSGWLPHNPSIFREQLNL